MSRITVSLPVRLSLTWFERRAIGLYVPSKSRIRITQLIGITASLGSIRHHEFIPAHSLTERFQCSHRANNSRPSDKYRGY